MKDISLLVVDDMPEIRAVIKHFAKMIGVGAIYECKDGLEALATLDSRLNAAGPLPEMVVILCDMHMPNMNGIELLRAIRRGDQQRKTAVIMISGDGTEETIVESIKSGADAFIVKPCSLKTIEDKIRIVLERRGIR